MQRLHSSDAFALLDHLIAREPASARPAGFKLKLQRLRELVAAVGDAELSLSQVAEKVFPGVSRVSLRTVLADFRKTLAAATKGAGVRFDLIRPDMRGELADVKCHFEGEPLPPPYTSSDADEVLSREHQVIEPRARVTRVFVSFAVKDQKLAQEFTEQMKVILPLRCREPVDLWRFDAKGGILPGENNETEIRARMAESQFGLLLLSPTYLNREFIQRVELPHFLGPSAKAHPLPVALDAFTPGKDKHDLLDSINVFTHKGKPYRQTPKKDRAEFIGALCEHLADLIAKYPARPTPTELEPIAELPSPDLDSDTYVPPKGRAESLARPSEALDDGTGEAGVLVLETLKDWTRSPADAAYMALLGESGSGKTMTCAKLDRELNTERPGSSFYIDLRHLNDSGLLKSNPAPMLETILSTTLARSANAQLTAERVLQAVRTQGTLLIWDGLDEVLVHLSAQEGNAFFSQLRSALPAKDITAKAGRLLFACRTQYFRTFEHEQSALTSAQRGPVNATAGSETRNRFRVLRLLPFDDHQIKEYLKANVPGLAVERAFEIINTVHNLRDLAGRPYCLSLMRASLADLDRSLASGKRVRSIDLYRNLVRLWLERDSGKHRIEQDDKPRLMARLAAWMWRESAKSLSAERLSQWLKETVLKDSVLTALYASAFTDAKRRDELLQDFRTATFIARWDGDTFRFAHTSLQEYFLAVHLMSALEDAQLDEWNLPEVNAETLDFAAELFVQRNAESASARTRLEQSLNALLGESVPQRSQNALRFYLRLHANGESRFVPAKIDARGLDLIAWQIKGSKARPLSLPNADFREAKLIRAEFRDVVMRDAKFNGTDLCSAELVRCDVTNADFRCAKQSSPVAPQLESSQPVTSSNESRADTEPPVSKPPVAAQLGYSAPRTRLEGVRFRWCQMTGSLIDGAILEGIRADLPTWDKPTEKHWREVIAAYVGYMVSKKHVKWLSPSVLGCTSPLLPSSGLDPHGLQWSLGHPWPNDSPMLLPLPTAAFTPDGFRLVSIEPFQHLVIWDAFSGCCIRSFDDPRATVSPKRMSANAVHIHGTIRNRLERVTQYWRWNLAEGYTEQYGKGDEAEIETTDFSPDSLRRLTSTYRIPLAINCSESGVTLRSIGSWDRGVANAWISRKGSFLKAYCHVERRMRSWNLDTLNSVVLGESELNEETWIKFPTSTFGRVSRWGTIRITRRDGTELDIAALPDDGYIILRKSPGENWRLAKAKGDYWRYVNCYIDGPNGRTLYSVGEPEDGTVE